MIGEAATVKETLKLAEQLHPDAVFLDVQLQGETGFDFVAQCPEPRPHIIFVTAHDKHAVRGFECNALDYLLKPVKAERLAEALARVRRQPSSPPSATIEDMVFLRIGRLRASSHGARSNTSPRKGIIRASCSTIGRQASSAPAPRVVGMAPQACSCACIGKRWCERMPSAKCGSWPRIAGR